MKTIIEMVRTTSRSLWTLVGVLLKTTTDEKPYKIHAGKNAIDIIQQNLGKEISHWSNVALAKLGMFEAVYGKFNLAHKEETELARKRLKYIDDFLDKMRKGIMDDKMPISIFCNDDHMVFDHTVIKKTMHEEYYKSKKISNIPPYEFTNKCAGQNFVALMMTTVPHTQDVLTICASSFRKWGNEHLKDWADRGIEDIVSEDLDDILADSPETSLFHELTHAEKYFGKDVMEDIKVDGEYAYQFALCERLGQAEVKKTDIGDNKALRNAESIDYFCAGVYLSQCNWRAGKCERLSPEDNGEMNQDEVNAMMAEMGF
ncbi:hypothetical protein N7492_005851 [Penicillium capsulatum]|uniref:Uncharacterized protein n=1 Tax=Penicillium capsulatum TaxID=69766 RepID=A0A9W9LSJ2_9EURO|nr:hypothetical protein N7492_005851 [Penicillium capsulatum]